MNRYTAGRAVALGAMSGMRSMAGPAVLAIEAEPQTHLTRAIPVLAAGELIADKLPFIGDRTDPLPLAGRALMGAISGAFVARETEGSAVLGGLLGAATAIVVAHLAYRARGLAHDRLGPAAGFIEDAVVVGMGAAICRRTRAVRARGNRAGHLLQRGIPIRP